MNSKFKVECFSYKSASLLQAAINNWLAEYSEIEVIDIKFSTSSCVGTYVYEEYSALVLYKDI